MSHWDVKPPINARKPGKYYKSGQALPTNIESTS